MNVVQMKWLRSIVVVSRMVRNEEVRRRAEIERFGQLERMDE